MYRLSAPMPARSQPLVLDLAPHRIHDPLPDERLDLDEDEDPARDKALRDSIAAHGQHVPVLVRPRPSDEDDPDAPETYDIVYGRRRLRVLKSLGRPVRALVSRLDDAAVVLARGVENTSRKDLSFIEKACLAAQLESLDHDRAVIAGALNIDAPALCRLLKVGRAFAPEFLRHIGPAPKVGRDRWVALAEALKAPGHLSRVYARLPALAGLPDSNERFDQVFAWARGYRSPPLIRRGPGWPNRRVNTRHGFPIGRVKVAPDAVILTLPMGDTPAFANWVNEEAETILRDMYDRWVASKQKPPKEEPCETAPPQTNPLI